MRRNWLHFHDKIPYLVVPIEQAKCYNTYINHLFEIPGKK
jgi:hypothetical protein